jgi:hypothetical protein
MEEERAIKLELNLLLEQDDLKWRQCVKVKWMRNGDRNTKFFHVCANQRKRRNNIGKIVDVNGVSCNQLEEIERAFVGYFQSLLSTCSPTIGEDCTSSITRKVSHKMNRKLLAIFSELEVKETLDQMDPMKAPGPDRFSIEFFQQNWETVGPEVCNAMLKFLNSAEMEGAVNSTNIVLIPKIKNPRCVSDFIPISLCNVLYKLISKVLVNRLKVVLPYIISCNQSAFILGRLITDNILAAYENLHTIHTHMWSKVGHMGIKLNMSKAYDRVEWCFIETVLEKLGFDPKWVKLSMECVKSVTYFVVVNGSRRVTSFLLVV